ncbi:metalloregulator ArsR/SmtB family transcription factor [Candidatus Woesearchaeota archaeon]|nr:metalloregulator ArsR/SmtB family transcription factor [Candidatus Woesearchaeota archaeon]
MKCASYEDFFKNFANKTKFRIIMHLKNKPMSVNELSKAMKEEQSKVSHNLAKLSMCNILNVEQKGKQRIYSLNKDTVIPMLKMVEKHVQKYCDMRCKK